MKKALKKALAVTLAAAMVPSMIPSQSVKAADASTVTIPDKTITPDDMVVAQSVYGWVTTAAVQNEDNSVTVGIVPAGETEEKTFTTALKYGSNNAMTKNDNDGGELIVQRCKAGTFAEVCLNAEGEVIDIRRVVMSGLAFDTAKYGGDLTAIGSTVENRGADYTDIYNDGETGSTGSWTGLSGDMVASGWIYGHEGNTILVGDGDMATEVFNETYELADDVKVYKVDTTTFESTESSLEEMPITPTDEDGTIYNANADERQQVVVIFDGDYTQYGTAKVREIYYYSSARTENVAGQKVSQYVGCVGQSVRIGSDLSEETQGSPSPNNAPYLCSANPTAVVDGVMWTIGDIEDNCPIFKGGSDQSMGKDDDGTWLTQFDCGWENDGYQYFVNIEKCGLDVRDIDQILIPHGHGDHYGSAYDEWSMIVRAGGSAIVYESYEDTNGYDIYGFDIPGIYTDAAVRSIITNWYPNDEWIDLGGGLQMQVTLTPGHSQGAGSAIFQVTVGEEMVDAKLNYELNDETGEYETTYSNYEPGDKIMFCYMGGYGINGLASISGTAGFRRLSFIYSLRYIESVISNMKTTDGEEPDGVYNLAQHTNQYPYTETALLMNEYNEEKGTDYGFLHFMREGREEVINFCEKRASATLYSEYTAKYAEEYAANGNKTPVDTYDGEEILTTITATAIFGNTVEDAGPYKHTEGEKTITIDPNVDILVMHGYDVFLNKGCVEPNFRKTTALSSVAVSSWDVSKGFAFAKDGFVYDPDAWYVQVAAHVDDDYDGCVYSNEGVNEGLEFTSAPVEAVKSGLGDGWFELIRTEKMTKEEAEELAASLELGGTYTVNMKKTGDIYNAENIMDTFKPVETTVTRESGENRYETALTTAETMKETLGVDTFDTVVLASGLNFPDALAGSSLAVANDAPILLVGNAAGTAETMDYVAENLTEGGKVYILGGESAVSADVEAALTEKGYEVVRLAGDTRYETNAAIVDEMDVAEGTDVVIVRGYTSYKANDTEKKNPQGYADSLAISSVAGASGMPIILADKDGLTDEQIAQIKEINPENIYVIGGTAAISEDVYSDIEDLGAATTRIYGEDRYETAVAIAEAFGLQDSDTAVVAYGENFPDGLTGGVLAAELGAPMILTAANKTAAAENFFAESKAYNIYVLGGTTVLPDATVDTLFE